MRYVWDRFDDYFGPGRFPAPSRPLLRLMARWLRAWDVRTASGVDLFAANSHFVAGRIRRSYGRDAEVIPPPVDTGFFTPLEPERAGRFDLIVSALVPYKRIELALEAYRGTGRRLVVAGSGPERRRLEAQAPPEAQFTGHVDDHTLRALYRDCRAVLLPGVEDFGIVPVEAMACGRPAVVFGEGGGSETVTPGETGIVFDQPTAGALRAAVDALDAVRFNTTALRARAESYSQAAFEARFRAFVTNAMAHQESTPAC
jgi:glycosyltransferase involved in cell wall biosynthesis